MQQNHSWQIALTKSLALGVAILSLAMTAEAQVSSARVAQHLSELSSPESRVRYFTRHYPFYRTALKDARAGYFSNGGQKIALEREGGTALMSFSPNEPELELTRFVTKPLVYATVFEDRWVSETVNFKSYADERGAAIIPDPQARSGYSPAIYEGNGRSGRMKVEGMKRVPISKQLQVIVEQSGPILADFAPDLGVSLSLAYTEYEGTMAEGLKRVVTTRLATGSRVVYAEVQPTGSSTGFLKLVYLDPQDSSSLIGETRPLKFWGGDLNPTVYAGDAIEEHTVRIPRSTFGVTSDATLPPIAWMRARSCQGLFK